MQLTTRKVPATLQLRGISPAAVQCVACRVAAAVLSLPAEAHAAVGRFAGGIMDALTKQLGVATRAQVQLC